MSKMSELQKIAEELESDKSLPLRESNLVFGEGNPDAEVLFIGEAPGFYENELRRPFVGRAGKLLDELIKGIGWRREDVYITNIVKRRPPENRDPDPVEIAAYSPYLSRQIAVLNPKAIATLGRFSMNYFLPEAKISRDRGKVFKVDGCFIFPLYHPAAALRSTQMLKELRADFERLPEVLASGGAGAIEAKSPAFSAGAAERPQKTNQGSLF
ncbi:MAG: uracil-DNA glycosylase [Candidatus Taylorbacteria bacterium]|nr:uracil-DNA glycosylase [Candidatus Taylorbacteria bacterium]